MRGRERKRKERETAKDVGRFVERKGRTRRRRVEGAEERAPRARERVGYRSIVPVAAAANLRLSTIVHRETERKSDDYYITAPGLDLGADAPFAINRSVVRSVPRLIPRPFPAGAERDR